MVVKRIVANIQAGSLEEARAFYGGILEMDVVMDLGWIVTFATAVGMAPQISVAIEGGAGAPGPDLSIEVDDLDRTYRKVMEVGHRIAYGPKREPWGVHRFFVRDPFGRLLNILSHD